jgi:hypothetical protein
MLKGELRQDAPTTPAFQGIPQYERARHVKGLA